MYRTVPPLEILYRQLGIDYQPEIGISRKSRNSVIGFDKSTCDESRLYHQQYPWNSNNFLRPIINHNWAFLYGENSTAERRQSACTFFREGIKFLNISTGALNGGLLPETRAFLDWLEVTGDYKPGVKYYTALEWRIKNNIEGGSTSTLREVRHFKLTDFSGQIW